MILKNERFSAWDTHLINRDYGENNQILYYVFYWIYINFLHSSMVIQVPQMLGGHQTHTMVETPSAEDRISAEVTSLNCMAMGMN